MTFYETLGVAWEGLALNKARSLLTTLGVIIGVALVIVMLGVSAGAEAAIAERINPLGADLIIVGLPRGALGAARTLVYDDARDSRMRGNRGVSAEQFTTQDVSGGGTLLEAISVLGVTPDFPAVRDLRL